MLEPSPGPALVATTDLLLEDVHFRRRWAEPADIGWKAMAVNVSDIAAMGARPTSVVASSNPKGWMISRMCVAGDSESWM